MKKFYSVFAAAVIVCVAIAGFSATARAANDETLVEAFGALSGLSLYNSHVIIGMAADAYVKEVYTAEETSQMIEEQRNMMKLVKEYNDKLLASSSLSADDKVSLKQINSTIAAINAMMNAFDKFIDEDSAENATAFDDARKASYASIANLLGLEK